MATMAAVATMMVTMVVTMTTTMRTMAAAVAVLADNNVGIIKIRWIIPVTFFWPIAQSQLLM